MRIQIMNWFSKEFDLQDVFKTEKMLLMFSGFYPLKHKNHMILHYFISSFNIIVSYLQLFSMIGQMIVDRNNLSALTNTLLFFMTHFSFLCKLMNFIHYRKLMMNIENDLSNEIFYTLSKNYPKLMKSKFDSCNVVGKLFQISCILSIFFYSILPLLEEAETLPLPLPGWIPYNVENHFIETATFQILSVCISAYNNSSIDILTWKLITIAAVELEVLKESLKNLDYKCDDEKDAKVAEAMFIKCVNLHTAVISLVQKIEATFSKGILSQFLSSIMVICCTGFQLIVVQVEGIEFTFLIIYFFCIMCQVAMYCWYGHEIIITSDELGRFCYLSNWYNSNMKIQKNMIIFLERTKKPLCLTAGSFVTLSLTTLTGILRSSYSYFAVLQRLYKDYKF